MPATIKASKKAGRAGRLGYDKPEDTIALGPITDLVKETGHNHWDSCEDFVKRLCKKSDMARSKVYPVLRRLNSYIMIDKTEGLKRQRITVLTGRIQARLDRRQGGFRGTAGRQRYADVHRKPRTYAWACSRCTPFCTP